MILRRTLLCTNCILPRITSFPKRATQNAATCKANVQVPANTEFEPVFKLPHINYIATFNRIKMYTAAGTVVSTLGCAALELLSLAPPHAMFVGLYVGVTSTALLSLFSLFTRNIIGYLYISTDDAYVKISMVDFWGLRRDIVVPVEDWVPLSSLPARNSDAFYLSPELDSSKTPMKLIVKMGIVLNRHKVAQLLE